VNGRKGRLGSSTTCDEEGGILILNSTTITFLKEELRKKKRKLHADGGEKTFSRKDLSGKINEWSTFFASTSQQQKCKMEKKKQQTSDRRKIGKRQTKESGMMQRNGRGTEDKFPGESRHERKE